MRRVPVLALVAGGTMAAVTGGAFLLARARRETTAIPKPVTGMFPNGMAYLRSGTGPKTLLWIPGGPGNTVPSGMRRPMLLRAVRPLVENGYTAWFVTRKQNMPRGHAIPDMADDYARLIADEFGGRVDLVVGMSYGGWIGFELAARHPDRFGDMVIGVAGYDASQEGKALDYEFARLQSEGRPGEAGALMVRFMNPRLGLPGLDRVLGVAMMRLMFGETHPYLASDMMVEAEAEQTFDARPRLPDIRVPVLLLCGDKDRFFPKHVYEETARLIPDCKLRMYEGVGHSGVFNDPRFARDILDFVRQGRSAAQPERDTRTPGIAEQPAASEEPVGSSLVGSGAG